MEFKSGIKRIESYNGKLDFKQGDNQIVGYDQNLVARLLISAQNNQFFMKISEENINVFTADDDQLIFNSGNNLFKIVEAGVATVSMPLVANGASGSGSDNVTHSLGYEPLVLAWSITTPGGIQVRPFPSTIVNHKSVNTTAVTIGYVRNEEMTITSTDITFDITVANSTGFAEPATDIDIMYFLLTQTVA